MYVWKTFFSPGWKTLVFASTPVISSKIRRLTRMLQQKTESMGEFPVKLPSKPALSCHPHQYTNNRNNALVNRLSITVSGYVQICFCLTKCIILWRARVLLLYTHHGTVFSTFSQFLSRKWKWRRANLGLFLDSATCSTSCRQFFEIRVGCGWINFK